MKTEAQTAITVWDPLVRICHWSLVVTFFTAYFTEDELLTVHVWVGYAIGCIIVLRIFWGFIGPKHSRFSDFNFGPWKVWTYLGDLISFRAERYIGHSPAGGAMMVALLIGLAATIWSGMETYAIEENAGPLAGMTIVTGVMAETSRSAPVRFASKERDDSERDDNNDNKDEFWEDAHEVLANLTLALIIIHMLGVGLTSIVHGENLTRAMITGKKRIQ